MADVTGSPPTTEQLWTDQLARAEADVHRSQERLTAVLRDAAEAGVDLPSPEQQPGMLQESAAVTGDQESQAELQERPPLPPAIFLRGAGAAQATWDELKQALWGRGWYTVLSRTEAWHLTRGRMLMLMVDFSERSNGEVKVVRVRAKFGDDGTSMELPVIGGTSLTNPRDEAGRLDVELIARTVHEVIADAMITDPRL